MVSPGRLRLALAALMCLPRYVGFGVGPQLTSRSQNGTGICAVSAASLCLVSRSLSPPPDLPPGNGLDGHERPATARCCRRKRGRHRAPVPADQEPATAYPDKCRDSVALSPTVDCWFDEAPGAPPTRHAVEHPGRWLERTGTSCSQAPTLNHLTPRPPPRTLTTCLHTPPPPLPHIKKTLVAPRTQPTQPKGRQEGRLFRMP